MKSKGAIHHLDTYGESEIEEGLNLLTTLSTVGIAVCMEVLVLPKVL